MPISFHCESCKKKIKAPDAAGGKWGNCPHCTHRCYIPLPASELEELTLIPLDENEEQEKREMINETQTLTKKLLRDMPKEESASDEPVNDKKILNSIILYLREIIDGQLEAAEKTAGKLVAHKAQAKQILSKMIAAERPEPELSDIAPKLLQSLIKQLKSKLQ